MKSKLFLIIITASFSFAVYSLFNNIGKAKNELRNPATAYIMEQQAAKQKTNTAKIKKQNGRQYNGNSNSSTALSAPAVSFGKHHGNLTEASLSDGNFTAQNIGAVNVRKRNISSSPSSGGDFAVTSYAIGSRSGGNDDLASASISSSTTSGPMSAPTGTNDVIVDPGGDPPPGTMIPVGGGMFAMMLLAGLYGAFTFRKKRN